MKLLSRKLTVCSVKKTKIQKKKIYGILFLGGTNLYVLQNLLTQHFHNSKWNSIRYKKKSAKKDSNSKHVKLLLGPIFIRIQLKKHGFLFNKVVA